MATGSMAAYRYAPGSGPGQQMQMQIPYNYVSGSAGPRTVGSVQRPSAIAMPAAQQLQQQNGLHPNHSASPNANVHIRAMSNNHSYPPPYTTVNPSGQPVQAPMARSIGQHIPLSHSGVPPFTVLPHHLVNNQPMSSPPLTRHVAPLPNSELRQAGQPTFHRPISAIQPHAQGPQHAQSLPPAHVRSDAHHVFPQIGNAVSLVQPQQPPPVLLQSMPRRIPHIPQSARTNSGESSQSAHSAGLRGARQPSLPLVFSGQNSNHSQNSPGPVPPPPPQKRASQPPQMPPRQHRQQESPLPMDEAQSTVSREHPPYLKLSTQGIATLRLLEYGQGLTAAVRKSGREGLDRWVDDFYTKEAHLKFNLSDVDHGNNIYDIPVCALARFYDVLRDGGAKTFQLLLETPNEYIITSGPNEPPLGYVVECNESTWIVGYDSGTQVFSKGLLRATFARPPLAMQYGGPQLPIKIESMEYVFEHHTEYVKRSAIIKKPLSPASTSTSQMTEGETPHTVHACESAPKGGDSSEMSYSVRYKRDRIETDCSTAASSPRKRPDIKTVDYAQSPHFAEMSLPLPAVGPAGVSDRAMRILEIAESVDHLGELIDFSLSHNLGPCEALEQYATLCLQTGAASREHVWPTPRSPAVSADSQSSIKTDGVPPLDRASASSVASSISEMRPALPISIPAPPSAPLPQMAPMGILSEGMTARSMPSSPSGMALDMEPFSFKLAP